MPNEVIDQISLKIYDDININLETYSKKVAEEAVVVAADFEEAVEVDVEEPLAVVAVDLVAVEVEAVDSAAEVAVEDSVEDSVAVVAVAVAAALAVVVVVVVVEDSVDKRPIFYIFHMYIIIIIMIIKFKPRLPLNKDMKKKKRSF